MEWVVEPDVASDQSAAGRVERGESERSVERQASEADVVEEDTGTLEEAGYGYGV